MFLLILFECFIESCFDLIQCALPVFDGLVEDSEHDRDICSLLFTFAEWHALAKLRMHTETTIGWLQQCTRNLGTQIRRFESHTCTFFDTRELPSEEAARRRRQAKKNPSSGNPTANNTSGPNATTTPSTKKTFNLFTIKLHALGDYVRTITTFGTTDSYSTQPVSNTFHLLLPTCRLSDKLTVKRENWNIDV